MPGHMDFESDFIEVDIYPEKAGDVSLEVGDLYMSFKHAYYTLISGSRACIPLIHEWTKFQISSWETMIDDSRILRENRCWDI